MKQTCHLATAGPDAKKSTHMKTATAGIDDGSGGSGGPDDAYDSSDLRLSGASATTTF